LLRAASSGLTSEQLSGTNYGRLSNAFSRCEWLGKKL